MCKQDRQERFEKADDRSTMAIAEQLPDLVALERVCVSHALCCSAEVDDTSETSGSPERTPLFSLRRSEFYVGQLKVGVAKVDQISFSRVVDERGPRSPTMPALRARLKPAHDDGKQANRRPSRDRVQANETERQRVRRMSALMKRLSNCLPTATPSSRLTKANVLAQATQHLLDLKAEVERLLAEKSQLKAESEMTKDQLGTLLENLKNRNEEFREEILRLRSHVGEPSNPFVSPSESENSPSTESSPPCDSSSENSSTSTSPQQLVDSPTVPQAESKPSVVLPHQSYYYVILSSPLTTTTPFYAVPAVVPVTIQSQVPPDFPSSINRQEIDMASFVQPFNNPRHVIEEFSCLPENQANCSGTETAQPVFEISDHSFEQDNGLQHFGRAFESRASGEHEMPSSKDSEAAASLLLLSGQGHIMQNNKDSANEESEEAIVPPIGSSEPITFHSSYVAGDDSARFTSLGIEQETKRPETHLMPALQCRLLGRRDSSSDSHQYSATLNKVHKRQKRRKKQANHTD